MMRELGMNGGASVFGGRSRGLLLIASVSVVAVLVAVPVHASAGPFLPLIIIAIGAGAVVVYRPVLGVIALTVVLPFNDLISQLIGSGTSAAETFGAFKDCVLACLVLAIVGRRGVAGIWIPRSVALLVGFTIALGCVSALRTPSWVAALYGLRNDFEPLLLILVVPAVVSARDARRVMTVVVAAGETAAAIAIATHARGIAWLYQVAILPAPPDTRGTSSYFVAGSPDPRAFSPYVAPNELGLASLIVVAIILYRDQWSWRQRAALLILPLLAILVSQSRSTDAGLFLLVLLRMLGSMSGAGWALARVWLMIVAIVVVGAATAGLASRAEEDASLGGHVESLSESAGLIIAKPVGLGAGAVGPRAVRYMDDPVLTESFVLLLALEAGPLALLFYLATLAEVARLLRTHRSRSAGAGAAALGLGAIVASIPNQLVLPSLQAGSVSWMLWIIVGLSMAVALDRSGPQRDEELRVSGRA